MPSNKPVNLLAIKEQRVDSYRKPYPSAGVGCIMLEGEMVEAIKRQAEAEDFSPEKYIAHVFRTGLSIKSELDDDAGFSVRLSANEEPQTEEVFVSINDLTFAGRECIMALDSAAKQKETSGPRVVYDLLAEAVGLQQPGEGVAEVVPFTSKRSTNI